MSRNFAWAAGLAALAVVLFAPTSPAAAASAAYTPRLLVTPVAPVPGRAAASPDAGGGVTVDLRTPADDDATARAVLHVPLGYRLGKPTPGMLIGRATGSAVTAGGVAAALNGTVIGGTADDASAACASAGTTVWLLQLTRPGVLIHIPLVVVAPPPSAATFASATITVCFPAASSVEAGGLRIVTATFTLGTGSITAPRAAGTYRWRALFTPFAQGSPAESPSGTVEAQSLVRIPARVTLSARLVVQRTPLEVKVTRTVKGKVATAVERRVLVTRFADLRGQALEFDDPLPDSPVSILGGISAGELRQLTQATPDATGGYAVRIQIDTTAKTVVFRARHVGESRDLGAAACTASFGSGVPCVGTTAPALKLESPLVSLATGR